MYLGIEVGVLGREEREGSRSNIELSKLLHSFLHPPGLSLLFCVSIFHNQRRRGSLYHIHHSVYLSSSHSLPP